MKRFFAAIEASSSLALAERKALAYDVRAAMSEDKSFREHVDKLGR